MKRNLSTTILATLSLLIILSCGGGGASGPVPPAGTAFFESAGGGTQMRGRLAFFDAGGLPVPGPAEGAVVLAGSGTRAGGADAQGFFTIPNVQIGSNLRVRCFARGYLAVDFNVVAGSAQTDQLRCQADTNLADNPQLQNEQFVVPNDGIARYTATAQAGTTLAMFSSPTLDANNYAGATGDTLPVTTQPQGNDTLFTGEIGTQIPTGSLYILAAGPGGVTAKTYGTCALTLSGYSRAGTLVGGKIMFGGVNCVGGEVLVWEEGNNGNDDDTTVGANGRFAAGLTAPPTGNVSVSVQWTNPITGIIYVCLWTGNP